MKSISILHATSAGLHSVNFLCAGGLERLSSKLVYLQYTFIVPFTDALGDMGFASSFSSGMTYYVHVHVAVSRTVDDRALELQKIKALEKRKNF